MPSLGPMEWILILLVLILLFGAKKLPDTARALGQSLRMFKKETAKMNDDDDDKVIKAQAETVTPAPASLPSAGPTVEERLRALEEENQRLRQSQAAVNAQAARDDQRAS